MKPCTRIALATLPLLTAGCHHMSFPAIHGSGIRVDEVRSTEEFAAVSLRLPADVVVEVGPATSLSISGDDNVLPLVETHVQGGRLVIDLEGNYRLKAPMKIHIETPRLESFEIEGSGDVEIRNVAGDRFVASIEGSGDLVVTGSVNRLEASIEGSGDMRLRGLKAREANLSIEGSGEMEVDASDHLHYSIEGSGDITYHGDPRVSGSVEGSGDVRRKRE